MSDQALAKQLTDDIRRIYAENPSEAAQAIETHLKHRLSDSGVEEGRAVVRQVLEGLSPGAAGCDTIEDKEILTRVFGLLRTTLHRVALHLRHHDRVLCHGPSGL